MIILGIETSCDDTGIAIVEADERRSKRGSPRIFNIRSDIVSSQIKVHQKYGGVVPNLAAREHLKNIEPCLKTALKEAKTKLEQINLIAVTIGPGLIPSLLIGVHFAKTLAYKYNKSIVPINHLEGHILSSISKFKIQNSKFLPAIALLVSGGHTQLVLVNPVRNRKFSNGVNYKIIGETRDDAAGECFDKTAKLLGLGYPGGPAISAQAEIASDKLSMINFKLPRPMIDQKNYDFSFSGLKTAVLYKVQDMKNVGGSTSHICAEVQQAIIDVLISKTMRAAKEYKAKTVILSGGVAANEELQKQFIKKLQNTSYKIQATNFLVPTKNLCTDNGAMIAIAGYFNKNKATKNYNKIKADANLRLS